MALEDLVRRPQPLQQNEVTDLSCATIARPGRVREKYVPLREPFMMFASESESWPRYIGSNIVKSVRHTEKAST